VTLTQLCASANEPEAAKCRHHCDPTQDRHKRFDRLIECADENWVHHSDIRNRIKRSRERSPVLGTTNNVHETKPRRHREARRSTHENCCTKNQHPFVCCERNRTQCRAGRTTRKGKRRTSIWSDPTDEGLSRKRLPGHHETKGAGNQHCDSGHHWLQQYREQAEHE